MRRKLTAIIDNFGTVSGFLRRDQFGRTFVDECPTDEIHLISPPPEGQERHHCRVYLNDLISLPTEYLGKRVEIKYDITVSVIKEN